MRRLKTYNDFTNEEINLKKSLIGGAIAASTLAGCSTDKGNNYRDTTSSNKIEVTDQKELPNSIDMNSTIDKRLVVFIPSFISSKQSEKESE